MDGDSVGKVIFSKTSKEDESDELTHNEVWDDSLLIQHYDDTMNNARKLLASKLSSASSVTDSECSNNHRTELVNGFSHSKLHSSTNIRKKKRKKGRKKNEWQTGDPCRSCYSEDGETYEATITGINNATGTCTVRFLGYNNYEEVAQSSLLKSKGDGVRKKQLKEVSEAFDQSDETTEDSCGVDSDAQSENQRKHTKHNAQRNMMPPPSPMSFKPFAVPPQSAQSIPHLPDLPPPPALGLVNGPDQLTSEALHTMLMSWYMTGYHTGYYQGLNHGRNHSLYKNSTTRNCNSRNN